LLSFARDKWFDVVNNFFSLETKGTGEAGFLSTEGGKVAEDAENLLMAIVWIEILQ
jgi:hypothetical protein